jgi:hypothetical protein
MIITSDRINELMKLMASAPDTGYVDRPAHPLVLELFVEENPERPRQPCDWRNGHHYEGCGNGCGSTVIPFSRKLIMEIRDAEGRLVDHDRWDWQVEMRGCGDALNG